jgi:hypothetical protein
VVATLERVAVTLACTLRRGNWSADTRVGGLTKTLAVSRALTIAPTICLEINAVADVANLLTNGALSGLPE